MARSDEDTDLDAFRGNASKANRKCGSLFPICVAYKFGRRA